MVIASHCYLTAGELKSSPNTCPLFLFTVCLAESPSPVHPSHFLSTMSSFSSHLSTNFYDLYKSFYFSMPLNSSCHSFLQPRPSGTEGMRWFPATQVVWCMTCLSVSPTTWTTWASPSSPCTLSPRGLRTPLGTPTFSLSGECWG